MYFVLKKLRVNLKKKKKKQDNVFNDLCLYIRPIAHTRFNNHVDWEEVQMFIRERSDYTQSCTSRPL